MPASALAFRVDCGQFVPTFIGITLKQPLFKAAMHQRVLTPRSGADGVMVGLLLFVVYFENLLHRCGDVELNPRSPKQDFFRQTRLTSSSRANNAELNSREGTSTSSAEMVGNNPILKDIMHMLTTMNSKFDDMKNDMSDIKESLFQFKR